MAPSYYCLGKYTEKTLVVIRNQPFCWHIHTKRLRSTFPHLWCSIQCMEGGLVVIFFSHMLCCEAKANVISSIIYTALGTSTGLFIIQCRTVNKKEMGKKRKRLKVKDLQGLKKSRQCMDFGWFLMFAGEAY